MPSLTLRERFYMMGKALTGSVSNLTPGSVGYNLLNRMYPAIGDPPKRGTLGMLQAYSTSPWLRAVSGRISSSVAAVPWKLYVIRPRGSEKAVRVKEIQRAGLIARKSLLADREAIGDLVPVPEHLVLDALDKGNPYQTGLSQRKLICIYMDLVGEVFLLKERNAAGKPCAFWPIPPSWVVAVPTVGWPFLRVSSRGWQANIPDTEVLWMSDPDPANPYGHGSGAGASVADEIDTDEAMGKTMKQMFFNRAKPDLIVMPTGTDTLSSVDTQRMEQQWLNNNQGFWRWFKPFFASRPLEVKEISQDLKALQFVQLRAHERDMIIQVTGGIPPELLGILESSNRATVGAAKYLFDTQVVIPRLEFQRAFLQEKLIPEYDERLILDYQSPVESDGEQQLTAMTSAPWAATVDEWRKVQGLAPLDNGAGRVYMVPLNLTPTQTFTPPVPAATGGPTPSEVVPPDEDPDYADEPNADLEAEGIPAEALAIGRRRPRAVRGVTTGGRLGA